MAEHPVAAPSTVSPAAPVAAAATGVLVALMAAVGPWPMLLVALPVLVAVAAVGRRHAVPELGDAALVVALLYCFAVLPVVSVWPISPGLALLVTGLLLRARGQLGRWRSWLRLGRVDGPSIGMVVALQVVSAVALLTWTRLFHGELAEVYADAAREAGPVLAGVGGVLFLVVNGLVEDSLFFGVLLSAASRTMPTWAALALSASVFGLAHLHGIPNGAVGVLMAGSWAVLLAGLRLRTGGMLATYTAHVVADATIVAMLLPSVFAVGS